jgi:hypothetical protein
VAYRLGGKAAEDAEDLEAFEARSEQPSLSFEDVVRDMKRRGEL